MTEKKASEVLKNQIACDKEDSCDGYCDECQHHISDEDWIPALNVAVSALKKQEQDRWIPCKERLPEEKDAGILKKLGTNKRSDYVLATVEVEGERMTVMACTYDGNWYWNMEYAFPDYKIIAWRSRPEPYTEEES